MKLCFCPFFWILSWFLLFLIVDCEVRCVGLEFFCELVLCFGNFCVCLCFDFEEFVECICFSSWSNLKSGLVLVELFVFLPTIFIQIPFLDSVVFGQYR